MLPLYHITKSAALCILLFVVVNIIGAYNLHASNLTIAIPYDHDHVITKDITRLIKNIEARSNNAIIFTLLTKQDGYDDKRILQELNNNMLDIGSVYLEVLSKEAPPISILTLPFIFDNTRHIHQTWAPHTVFRDYINKAVMEATNTQILSSQALYRSVIIIKHGDVNTPDATKNTAIGVNSQAQFDVISFLEGKPNIIPMREQAQYYRHNDLDVSYSNLFAIQDLQLNKEFVEIIPLYDNIMEQVLLINQDSIRALSLEHKEIIMQEAEKSERILRETTYAREAIILNKIQSTMTTVTLKPYQIISWRRALKQAYEKQLQLYGAWGALAFVSIEKKDSLK